jgi:hypothetical protein
MARKKKWLILIILFGIFPILIIALYVSLYPPLPLAPKIGRNLPSSFADADKEFSARIKNAFPSDITEARIREDLQQQGFIITTNEAVFSKSQFPCLLTWRVTWQANEGIVKSINASYGGSCL